jgi:arabinogalactan oligomer / maltooligosaccharide transport system substrate-binding protein
MQDLLLHYNLATSTPGAEVRQVARVQTITTLGSLDAGRNKIVFQFLQDAHLVGTQDSVINLSSADLSKDDLSGADLSGVDLSDATLTGADLDGAQLRGAILTGALINDASMNGATMTDALLNGADLTGADLTGAELIGANLTSADLTDTDLSGANLNDADLLGSYYAPHSTQPQQQLDAVYSCTNAILSPGLICHHVVKITLTYWYTESSEEQPVIHKLISQFESEKQYRNININAVAKPFSATQSAFTTAGLAGQPPDVLRAALGWVGQFASQGYLLNLDPYASQFQNGLSDYPGNPLGTTRGLTYDTYQGNLYGVPQVTDFLALLYNKAELQKAGITSPPATMTDFAADAIEVAQKEKGIYGFETNGSSYDALPFLYAFGGGMIDQNKQIVVDSPGSVQGLMFLLNLQKHHGVMPQHVDFSDEPASPMVNDFMRGKTAMIFDGPYDLPQILLGRSFLKDPGNLGIAAIPTGPAGQTGSPLGGQSYVISAATDYPAEAADFISFMSEPRNQLAIAEANHTLTPLSPVYAHDKRYKLSSDRFVSAFLSIAGTAVGPPSFPQATQLSTAFDANIADALDGVESPSLALYTVANTWKQLLPGS